MRVTANELAEIMLTNESHTFVGVSTVTDAEPLKKNRVTKQPLTDYLTPESTILKAMRGTFSVGNTYSEGVNRRRKRDWERKCAERLALGLSLPEEPGEFVPEPHGWFVPIGDSKIVGKHKDDPTRGFYLAAFFFNTPQTPANLRPKSFYFDSVTGQRLRYADISGWLPKPSASSRQGLPNDLQVQYRNYKFVSFHRMAIGGTVYTVTDPLFSAPPAGLEIHAFNAAEARLYETYVYHAINSDTENMHPVVERIEQEIGTFDDPLNFDVVTAEDEIPF